MRAELVEVARRLTETHPEWPPDAVVDVVHECADMYPAGSALFVEQAARARLDESLSQFDVVHDALDDPELRNEVELSVRLIVAANASSGSLSAEEVDALLGLRDADPVDQSAQPPAPEDD